MIQEGPLYHKPKSIIAARNMDIRVVFSNGILLILLYFAIRYIGFGKKWARILFLVLFVITVLASEIFVPFLFRTNIALGFLFIFQMLLQVLALVFLYSKSSNEWFNRFERVDTTEKKI